MLSWFKRFSYRKEEETIAYLFVTLPSRDLAISLSKELLEKRLVACVSFFPVTSMFFWNEKICETSEVKILLKSRISFFDAIAKIVREKSSYDITEVTLFKTDQVDLPYLNWLFNFTHSKEC